MIPFLYRYREIDRLLGESQELEKQEIYFASPDQLNDPMEGFKDIYWIGDRVIWTNLFKHYLFVLTQTFVLFHALEDEQAITKTMLLMRDPRRVATEVPVIQDTALQDFLSYPEIQELIIALSERQIPVRADELISYVTALHPVALIAIQKASHANPLDFKYDFNSDEHKKKKTVLNNIVEQVRLINRNHDEYKNNDKLTAFFAANRMASSQLNLINRYNGIFDPAQENRNFLCIDFPQTYVQQLEILTYPDWYAACFMEDYKNSSAWGHYAKGHTGVCLEFNVTSWQDRPSLNLRGINGWGSGGNTYGETPHAFNKVNYESAHVSVDFFQSLGSLPIPIINRDWYYFDKTRSSCADGRVGLNDENRSKYWNSFSDLTTIKSSDWEDENEFRILLSPQMLDLTERKDRLLQYKFSDLQGIIFGIKTSIQDKLKIMKIIENKCIAEKRTDFKFYQAYYSVKTQAIEKLELSFLKFST